MKVSALLVKCRVHARGQEKVVSFKKIVNHSISGVIDILDYVHEEAYEVSGELNEYLRAEQLETEG